MPVSPAPPRSSAGWLTPLTIVCFFLSGLGSLALEVVWTRMLRLVFGSTTLAVSTVLVAYMLGLGFGGLAGGRFARRVTNGVRWYGLFEILIALYALAVPTLLAQLPAVGQLFLYRLPLWPAALARFLLSILSLALPTFLMGATLPLVVSSLARQPRVAGRPIALLYGVNTFGAVSGVLLATFLLFPTVGLLGTNAVGALTDLVVGILAVAVLARPFERAPEAATPGPAAARSFGLPVWAYALVGFTALVYEVAWTRALSMVLGSSIHAFAAMLAAFLTGIALGSLAIRGIVDRMRRPLVAFALGVGLLGLLSLGTLFLLPELPALFLELARRYGLSRGPLIGAQLGLSMLAMLPPTLVLGALFPLLARALAESDGRPAEAVGRVYFANTLGSATGAFAAGFLLIPALGLQGTLTLAAVINFLTAAALLVARHELSFRARVTAPALAIAVALALTILPARWDPMPFARGSFFPGHVRDALDPLPILEGIPPERVVFYREGLNTTVSVHELRAQFTLNVNGKPDASSLNDMPTQVLSAHVPLLMGPPAEDVLVIGWASGVTVGSVLRHPVRSVTVVELEPAIIEASRFFERQNGRPLEDPRVRVVLDDGRTYLSYAPERFDVIISEPSNPWITGASSLFTVEHMRAARAALKPGGRLLQWVQLYGMDPEGLRSLLATVGEVFPYVYGLADYVGRGDLLLLAASEPLGVEDLPRWEGLPASVREDLVRVSAVSTEDLWSLVRLLPEDVRRIIGEGAVINSDSNLFIELRTPWLLHQETAPQNWQLIQQFPTGIGPLLGDGDVDGELLGALAFSYLTLRRDAGVAKSLIQLVEQRGVSANAVAARVSSRKLEGSLTFERQRRLLDQAVDLRPDVPYPRMLRAQALVNLGHYGEALDDVDRAILARPDDPRIHTLRAVILGLLGRWPEAARVIEELLAGPYGMSRDAIQLHTEAARAYYSMGRIEEGVRHLESYVQLDPYSVGHWQNLASGYERLGRAEDAQRARRNVETLERETGAAPR